jgi:hypothetical protein
MLLPHSRLPPCWGGASPWRTLSATGLRAGGSPRKRGHARRVARCEGTPVGLLHHLPPAGWYGPRDRSSASAFAERATGYGIAVLPEVCLARGLRLRAGKPSLGATHRRRQTAGATDAARLFFS